DCEDAVEWGEKAAELAKRFGAEEVVAAAEGTVGAALLFIDYEAGIKRLEHALNLSIEGGFEYIAANCYSNLGSGSGEIFKLRAAERYLQSAVEYSTVKEVSIFRTYSLAWLGFCDLYLGRWDDAESHAQEAVDSAPKLSTTRVMALCALGRLKLRRGDE